MLVSAWVFHFLYPVCYTVAVHNTKSSQKHIVRSGRARDAYAYIALSTGDFEKAYDKEDHELCIDGKMYEAIDFHTEGDTVHCSVLYDDKETKLRHGYSAEHKHTTTKAQTVSLAFWCAVNYVTVASTHATLFTDVVKQPLFRAYHSFLSTGYTSRIPMPPELVIV